jgi:hypothetical protein
MNYIELDKVPKNRAPIYFCNVIVTITEVKRRKKASYNREIEKVVLKGLNEDDLIKDFCKYRDSPLTVKEQKNSKITSVKIELLNNLGFGVL